MKLQIKELDFIPVLLGSDNNTYSMARAFHEAYQVKSIIVGRYPTGPCWGSRIIDFRLTANATDEKVLLPVLDKIAAENKGKKLLLIPTYDNYLEPVVKNQDRLREKFIVPYISYEAMLRLYDKSSFYKLCEEHGLDHPKTFHYTKDKGFDYKLGFDFPVIVKPADGLSYDRHSFDGQKKLYKINTREELDLLLKQIYDAGYDDTMIIQDFIPGDDSNMRVVMAYSDQRGKAQLLSMGHVLLDSHTPWGLGSHTGLITTYDKDLLDRVEKLLNDINFVGLIDFDIKYDPRDKKYKFLEINVRQGRSHYYVTAAGGNLAQYLADDFVYGRQLTKKITREKILWLVVPKRILFKYVKSEELKAEIRELIRAGKMVNPLFYRGDLGLIRLLHLLKYHFMHFRDYKKYGAPLN